MHIADITMFYAPESGGIRTYLRAKHRALGRLAGLRHSILIPGSVASVQDGIHTLPAPAIPFSRGHRFPVDIRPWRDRLLALQPDIIEVGDPYRLPWAALRARDRLGIPVVGFYHSDLPRLVHSRFGRGCGKAAERYVRRLYRHFDLVLAPSRIIAAHLEGIGLSGVALQPLGVDTQRFHPRCRDERLRRELGLADSTRLLIFAGRGSREKNIPLLLETLALLGPRYHLLLIGPGMPVHDVPANVTVCPRHIESLALARFLASADALIHAGAQETFGLIVLEAMASGLPVIGTASGAVAELVPPDTGVLAEKADAHTLAEAAEHLFQLDHRAMGSAARARIETEQDWDTIIRQLLAHYARVLAGGRLQPLELRRTARPI